MFAPFQLLGWVFNLYGHNFICECMLHPLLFLFLLELIHLSMQIHVLPWVSPSVHATPSLFHSLSFLDLRVTSSPHILSLQGFFHHQWISLSSQFCSTSVLSTTFLLHSLHSVCFLQLLFTILLAVMLLLSYLDVLAYEKINVFVSRQSHRHLIDCIPKCSLNSVLEFALLETLYLCCWEADERLWYLETWKHSWQATCQSKTKMNLSTNLQHTCVVDHEGCAISSRRSGDRLPRLHKAYFRLLGDWLTTGTM